jgi:hypothetical protein
VVVVVVYKPVVHLPGQSVLVLILALPPRPAVVQEDANILAAVVVVELAK